MKSKILLTASVCAAFMLLNPTPSQAGWLGDALSWLTGGSTSTPASTATATASSNNIAAATASLGTNSTGSGAGSFAGSGNDGNLMTLSTDPWANDGDAIFSPIRPATSQILPDIVKPFLPKGSYLENLGDKNLRDSPDANAVVAIIVFMAQSFQGKANSGETGYWLWKIALIGSYAGLFLSGFMIFQGVSQGKKSPGEAIISYLTKVIIVVTMLSVVTPNVPSTLIGLINTVTQSIATWYHSSTSASGLSGEALVKAVYSQRMLAGTSAASVAVATVVSAIESYAKKDPTAVDRMNDILADIKASDVIKKATGNDMSTFNEGLQQVIAKSNAATTSEEVDAVNQLITEKASAPISAVMEEMDYIIDKHLSKNSAKESDKAILGSLLAAPQNMDLTSFRMPSRVVSAYAYTAFVYLAISIWGAGFAALVWTALYAMPEEWNLSGALVSGFKGLVGIVLAAVLIGIYLAASLEWTADSSKSSLTSIASSYGSWLMNRTLGGVAISTGISILNGTATPGTLLGKMFSAFTGITLDEFMVGMLILTAPAQAALMVKGGNGLAEHAKSALHAGDAGSSGIAGFLGMRGAAALNASPSNSTMGQIMQGGAPAVNRQMFAPNRGP